MKLEDAIPDEVKDKARAVARKTPRRLDYAGWEEVPIEGSEYVNCPMIGGQALAWPDCRRCGHHGAEIPVERKKSERGKEPWTETQMTFLCHFPRRISVHQVHRPEPPKEA